jgi:adenylate cyclase
MSQSRRLAAILAADVVGYSRLMGTDEEGTLERLKALRGELIDPNIAKHHGRIVKTTGDGLLVEFASVVDAVRCAAEVQQAMPEWDAGIAADRRIKLRIGINLGDGIADGDDLYGDGVNIAARIETLADAGGLFVSGTVYDQVRDRLTLGFEDRGEQQVKNIARPIRVYRVLFDEAPSTATNEALPLPDKPSIAVLPFQNMSGDPEQDYFADGMVEEITTTLSRIRSLFVIARNSSFTYKGEAVDVKQVGRGLGVRYILEGSVRKGGNRVRITAQLVDAVTGTHLWADRFEGSLEDIFALQDRVAISVAGVIEPALQAAEAARSANRPTNDLTAYDLYLRAYPTLWSSARQIPQALRLLEQAIARDPNYGPALAVAALCCFRLLYDERSEDREVDRVKGAEYARRALEAAGDDPGVLANAAYALAFFGEDIGAMMALADRAVALNPNSARSWALSSYLRIWAGQLDVALEHHEVADRLSPHARVGTSPMARGAVHFLARHFEEAVPKLLLAIHEDPSLPQAYRCLAACYAHMGRLDEAREIIRRLRMIAPVMISDASYLRNPEHRELLLSGLHLAMGETA